jgi:hypothetical protein
VSYANLLQALPESTASIVASDRSELTGNNNTTLAY